MRIRLPAKVRYRIVHDRDGVRLDGEAPEPEVPDPGEPAEDVSVGTPTSSAANEAIGWAETIPALADVQQPTSPAGKTAVGKLKNRAREIVRLIRLGSAAARREAIGWAETFDELAADLRPVSPAAKKALGQIKNRGVEIIRLLKLPG